jgi:hypothetical protein
VDEGSWVLEGDTVPVRESLLCSAQSFEFLPNPSHQVGIDALQQWIQLGAVEPPVVLHPSGDDGVDDPGQFGPGPASSAVQPPRADYTPEFLQGLVTDRGQKSGE